MVQCFVPGCEHRSQIKLGKKCQFFSFPRNHSPEYNMWLNFVKRPDHKKPNVMTKVCSCHFKDGLRKNGPTISNIILNVDETYEESVTADQKSQNSETDDSSESIECKIRTKSIQTRQRNIQERSSIEIEKDFEFNVEHMLKLCKSLFRYFEEGILCDLIVMTKCKELKAHSVVLAASSSIFYQSVSSSNGIHVLDLSNFSTKVVEILLHFIYTGELENLAEAIELDELNVVSQVLGINLEIKEFGESRQPNIVADVSSDDVEKISIHCSEENYYCVNSPERSKARDCETGYTNLNSTRSDEIKNSTNFSCNGNKSSIESKEMQTFVETGEGGLIEPTVDSCIKIEESSDSSKHMPSSLAQEENSNKEALATSSATESDESQGKTHLVSLLKPQTFSSSNKLKLNNIKTTPNCQVHTTGFSSASHLRKPTLSRFHCKQCGRHLRSEKGLQSHMNAIHISSSSEKVQTTVDHGFQKLPHSFVSKNVDRNNILCDICGISFSTTQCSAWCSHLKDSDSQTLEVYKCEMCQATFRSNGYLKNHMHLVHQVRYENTGQSLFLCDICGKSFQQHNQLECHTAVHHFGFKPFKCDTCNLKFTSNYKLQNHIRTHTGEKPYGCSTCTKTFRTKSNLRVHCEIHAKRKRHVCSYCGNGFSARSNLNHHMKKVHDLMNN